MGNGFALGCAMRNSAACSNPHRQEGRKAWRRKPCSKKSGPAMRSSSGRTVRRCSISTGMTIVCADSHTSTHGALGALAFGIGATEVAHVLATQSLWQLKPKTMRIAIDGNLRAGVSAKDIILSIIAKIGIAGGIGHVVE